MQQMHPHLKKRIGDLLTEQVPNLKVTNNCLVHLESFYPLLDIDNSLDSKVKAALERYIGGTPIFSFVVSELQEQLQARDFQSDVGPVSLPNLPEFGNTDAVVSGLLDALTSLPWKYTLLARIPLQYKSDPFVPAMTREILGPQGVRELRPGLSLFIPDDSFDLPKPEKKSGSFEDLLERDRKGSWGEGILYIKENVEGYVSPRGSTGAVIEKFQGMVKSFLGMALSRNLLELNVSHSAVPRTHPILVYRINDEEAAQQKNCEFSPEESKEIDSAQLVAKPFDIPGASDADVWNHLYDPIVESFQIGDEGERILRAAQWYFESHCGSNQLLNFVQATIVLEILLGDATKNEKIGLSELLRNRCAYLIGESHTERSKLMNDFDRIYATRSSIVHTGHNKLTMEQRSDLATLRYLCARVIGKELEVLRRHKD